MEKEVSITKESEKPVAAKPSEAPSSKVAQPQANSDEAEIVTPKAQFVKSDHKIAVRDSAIETEQTAQFKASDHKFALTASKNKNPKTVVPKKQSKE